MPAVQPDTGLLRWLRVGAYSLPAVGFAVAMHVLARGCVSALGVAEAAVTCVAAGGMALRGERSKAQLAGWLLGCQAVTHVLLQLHCAHPEGLTDARMLLAHLAAAGLAAAALTPTERAVWAATRIAQDVRRAAALCTHAPTPVLTPRTTTTLTPYDEPLPTLAPACPPPARRGPPAFA